MAKVTVVVGLPGSGKSHLIRELASTHPGICVEDFHANAIGNSPHVTASRHYCDLVRCLKEGKDCAVADIAFTDRPRRDELQFVIRSLVPGVEFEWVWFENDVEQCIANIQRRDRDGKDREADMARHFGRLYAIPDGAVTRPIWRP